MANERSIGKFKQSLENLRTKGLKEITDDLKEVRNEEYKKKRAEDIKKQDNKMAWEAALRKGRGTDIPDPYVENNPEEEHDVKVVDLPEEEKYDKALVIDDKEATPEKKETKEEQEEPEPSLEEEVSEENIEQEESSSQEEDSALKDFNEAEMVDPSEEEENSVSEEEAEEPKKEDKSNDKDATLVEGAWNMSNPKYRRALAEAQAMAQDDLDDFRVSEDWENWTPKQKADSIKAWRDAKDGKEPPKVEDHRTNIDDSENNYFEAYKRYPTELRVAEDVAGIASDIVKGAGDVAKTDIGGTGANMISERAKGVPHYDYTSLFGRR